jgi:hypothetical protein
LASVLLSLATGLLSGVGSAAGSLVVDYIKGCVVIYSKKNGLGCEVVPADQGLCLKPWNRAERWDLACKSKPVLDMLMAWDTAWIKFSVPKHSNTKKNSLSYQKLNFLDNLQ